MALTEAKTLDSERNLLFVKSNKGSRLTGTVEENKNVFDKFPQLNMDKHNKLIDLLTGLGLDTIVTDLADRYTVDETETRLEEETNDLIETIEYTKADGKFKITTKAGEVTILDTDLEKIPASFDLLTLSGKTYLRITNQDGTYTQTEVTSLLNVYTFTDSDTIDFTENPTYKVTAIIKPNSILLTHLSSEVVSALEALKSAAEDAAVRAEGFASSSETSAQNSGTSALWSESYTHGGTGKRTDEDTDNAKYYKENVRTMYNRISNYYLPQASHFMFSAQSAASAASGYANRAEAAEGAAQTAQYKAETAQSKAETAQGAAETAQGAAETAQSKAETAQGAAETAQSKAETAAKTAEETVASKAPLDSPAFTGTPTAPTPDEGDDSTRIATTAFVESVKSAALGGVKFSITDNGLLHVEQEV